MDVPTHVARWVDNHYPKPKVDPEWLSQCYEWLVGEGHDAATKFKALTDAISHQILESNLSDSMLPGSGLPPQVASLNTTTKLTGTHVLVEIVSITEVAHSAFNLNQTRAAIEERMKEGNIEDGEGEADIEIEGEGPMPKYPRGMLKFHLSDGSITLPAMEYRSLPELSIESTPLGFKLLLRNTQIRRGVAFLEPNTVTLIGHKTDDRDVNRHKDFARGLRMRMGLPEPPDEEEMEVQDQQEEQAEPQPARSPLREISPPISPTLVQRNDGDDPDTRRRRIPSQGQAQTPVSTSTTLVTTGTSRYFSSGGSEPSSNPAPASLNLSLSPPRRNNPPLFLPSPAPSPVEENFWANDIEMLDAEPENQQKTKQPTVGTSPTQKINNIENNPNVRLLGKLKQQAEKHAAGTGKGKAPATSMGGYISDDYDDMSFNFDGDMLDAMEQTGYASQGQKDTGPSRTVPPSTQFASKKPAPAVVDLTRAATMEIITIDDEEDAVDKENVPVPARNVRRRTDEATSISAGPPRSQRPPGQPRVLAKTESAVIDLSDSD